MDRENDGAVRATVLFYLHAREIFLDYPTSDIFGLCKTAMMF